MIQRLDARKAERDAARSALKAIPPLPNWWIGNFELAPGPFHVFLGGDPQRPGTNVRAASLGVLKDVVPGYVLPVDAAESRRRLALADWLVDPRNPLTPRVLANRIWHYHFGTGLVDTPSDFGFMGVGPATRICSTGWRIALSKRVGD